MNNYIKYTIELFISAWLMISCTAEESLNDIKSQDRVQSKTVQINFATPTSTSVSILRASRELPPADFIVSDLYIYIFDAETGELLTRNGEVSAPVYLEGEELLNGTFGGQEMKENPFGEKYNSSWVRVNVDSKAFNKYVNIFMIANAASYNELSLTHEELIALQDMNSLQNHVYQYNTHINQGRTSFLMTGHNIEGGLSIKPFKYHIDKNGKITTETGAEAHVTLERAETKINFNIKQGIYKKGNFTPISYKIYNYPKYSNLYWQYLLEKQNSSGFNNIVNKDASKEESDFFTTESINITKEKFCFYMPENLKGNSQNFDTKKDPTTGLNQRELRDESGKWKNAPQYATYIEIKGRFKGNSDKLDKEIEANVTYTIHLGFSRDNADDNEYRVNDYLIKRNYEYTYNMTINGVDDIAIEVIDDNEKMSAAEGDITLTEEITLSKDSKLIVNNKETLEIQSSDQEASSWLQIENEPINIWILKNPKAKQYQLTADELPEGISSRKLVLQATRTSTDGRSKIIRRITITQQKVSE